MNTVVALQEYLTYTFDETPGMKALIVDSDTIPVVSVLFSMTEIIQKEVYLVQQLSDPTRDSLPHLNAVCLLRPSKENMELLKNELSAPKYGKYYLYFTNFIDTTQLTLLSHSDIHEVVQKVLELYVDYMPINDDLFVTSCPNFYSVTAPNSFYLEQKTINSLTSLCLSLKKNPSIRFQQNSELSKRIAEGLSQQLEREKSTFTNSSTGTTLIIVDRNYDPITPLLTQWTYQAMIHEFVGIENGKVVVDDRSLVLTNDDFFIEHMYLLFSDITDSIVTAVNDLTRKAGVGSKQYASLEEMKQVIESIPQLKKESVGVKKHLGLMGIINKAVSVRRMLDVSRLEQEIVCSSGRAELFQSVVQMFSGDFKEEDKIRVGMLYALKYEEKCSEVIQELNKVGIHPDKTQVIETVIRYAGANKRPLDIFTKVKSVLGFVKKSVAGVENVFVQHKPLLDSLLEPFVTQQLQDKFPFCRGGTTNGRDFIIFVVGGVTFEEEIAVATRNRNYPTQKIILGGTDILNTTKFINEIKVMKK
ncbi:vacuolar protein sorting-associated protein, putative [Entamoeba invadens IP1]|uniref:Vacuolar protein sorting-associated protein, putative n=2 Tax=Entamoeba invadens TaxID=33085 RepID=A0A0A1TWR5_ENTIV|nr:vacuolar protein sorting-associated protein, putative [Entamoeba invadens IP1]ELP85626.1 vacuolar protein sorting-associated protein, putative [Entamoeba invadens IP1]BAN41118.1 vacuolar protein sorting-associated protein, putative [Entamoeba invadens]BAN41447.1 vacuolar protein sorting-associated protein, putative [Entamoeba invadens]|eukprot:XP_004184972.1 vacuolar protein sorting-associated protein, putative [Entamoeba invadens IP1]